MKMLRWETIGKLNCMGSPIRARERWKMRAKLDVLLPAWFRFRRRPAVNGTIEQKLRSRLDSFGRLDGVFEMMTASIGEEKKILGGIASRCR